MFVADLSIWSLQRHDAGDLLSSWVLDTLANSYPTGSLTSKASDALQAFRVQLTVALETALLEVCPELQLELGEHWPQQKRKWWGKVADEAPPVQGGLQVAETIHEIVQSALHGMRWQQARSTETVPELQKIAEQISARAAEVARYQQDQAEAALGAERTVKPGMRRYASDITALLLRATKLVMRALDLQHQGGQHAKTDVSAQCTQVCEFLLPITSRGDALFTSVDEERDEPLLVATAIRVIKALCRRGDLELCAIAAVLGGRSDIAAKWQAAATACADGVSSDEDEELDERARWDLELTLERAEILAELARRAEEAALAAETTVVELAVAV
jgi:hypothetical protein